MHPSHDDMRARARYGGTDVGVAFFEGVDGHTEGAKVWNAALDESK